MYDCTWENLPCQQNLIEYNVVTLIYTDKVAIDGWAFFLRWWISGLQSCETAYWPLLLCLIV